MSLLLQGVLIVLAFVPLAAAVWFFVFVAAPEERRWAALEKKWAQEDREWDEWCRVHAPHLRGRT